MGRLSQEDDEDCPEEIKRLEDKVEALAILKDYTSLWPVGVDGMPIADGLDTSIEEFTTGPASDKVCMLNVEWARVLFGVQLINQISPDPFDFCIAFSV